MAQQIIQINFNFNAPVDTFKDGVADVAKQFATVPGLEWKIWILNEVQKEAGGIYLFTDEEAVSNFKNSPLFQMVATNPAFQNFSVKQFDIIAAASLLTNAPLNKDLTTA